MYFINSVIQVQHISLNLNHGDIKVNQVDVGYSQADTVMEVYGHILYENRKVNAQKFDELFYKNSVNGIDYQKSLSTEVDVDSLIDSLKSNPEMLSQLVQAL